MEQKGKLKKPFQILISKNIYTEEIILGASSNKK